MKKDVTNKIVADPNLAIEIRHFTKKFKDFKAVDNIDMTVSKGKIHGFIGPNGSGKTTTIKSIIGAIIPTEGKLFIHGMKSASTPAKRIIGYIPENARFPKHLNVYQYLVEMSFLRGLKYRQAKTRAEKILENLNLWKFRKKNPNNFSSGMKKKVLLAQALITNPDVLILDEPAANLDPTARQELFNDLLRVREEGKTILICSHILTELQGIADEITILNYGKVVYAGEVINATHNYYQFTVMESAMLSDLTAIVERYNYKIINKTPDSLIIHLPKQNDDIKTIAYNAMEKRIVLTQIQPYITNISEIYDRVVFSVNRDFGKASALLQPGE